MNTQWLDLDLHRLDLRFAGARVAEPRAVERIARSIERGGQIVPCVVVADPPVEVLQGGQRLVLIDGYRRIAALRRLGRDTARVDCWACDLAEAVLGVLARSQSRPLAAIEEALLVRELVEGLGLSQHEIARRSGRDVSWVSRRLQLLAGLPELELRRINVLIRSVRKRLPGLCPLSAELTATLSRVQTQFEALGQDIKQYAEHDPHGDPQQRACSQGARS
jgi:ParB-like chromosome segregation protein Spo0J